MFSNTLADLGVYYHLIGNYVPLSLYKKYFRTVPLTYPNIGTIRASIIRVQPGIKLQNYHIPLSQISKCMYDVYHIDI